MPTQCWSCLTFFVVVFVTVVVTVGIAVIVVVVVVACFEERTNSSLTCLIYAITYLRAWNFPEV